jgi:hypothetical protein
MSSNLRSALYAAGAVILIALGAFMLALPNDTDTPESAPTTTVDEPNCHERENLPPNISCGDVVKASTLAITIDLDAAQDALNLQNLFAAMDAEKAAAARSSSYGGTSFGGSCGGGNWVIPEYIVQRESGCSYDAYNATGCDGQGCIGAYQLHAQHFNGGVCSDLGTDPAGQDECAARLWNGGAGAGNWAATL